MIAASLVGVAIGMTFGIAPLAGIAGTFLVLYLAAKPIDMPADGAIGVGMILLASGSVMFVAWSVATAHQDVVMKYLTGTVDRRRRAVGVLLDRAPEQPQQRPQRGGKTLQIRGLPARGRFCRLGVHHDRRGGHGAQAGAVQVEDLVKTCGERLHVPGVGRLASAEAIGVLQREQREEGEIADFDPVWHLHLSAGACRRHMGRAGSSVTRRPDERRPASPPAFG